jgi:hypothetical protein
MVEFKSLYLNEFHANINDYNNASPIIKISREQTRNREQNLANYYPNKAKLM